MGCAICGYFGSTYASEDGREFCGDCAVKRLNALEHRVDELEADAKWLILSVKHTESPGNSKPGTCVWWRPDSRGYTWYLEAAGRYPTQDARMIVLASRGVTVAIPERVVLEMAGFVLPVVPMGAVVSTEAIDRMRAHQMAADGEGSA